MQGYYLKDGQPEGPLSMENIIQKARNGEIAPQTLVWNETMDGWRSLSEAYPQIFPSARLAYASFWERAAAYLIDLAVCNIGGGMVVIPLMVVSAFFRWSDDVTIALAYFFSGLVGVLYFTVMESSRLQGTLGKMALRLKVTGLKGERISFGRALLRYFSRILSGVILMIGYLMMLWSPKSQCLHDCLAGTLVVKKDR